MPTWQPQCGAWLRSAVTGGQWPQTRRRAVKSWGASPLCQLCGLEPGTLEHRRTCVRTRPLGGWTVHSPGDAAWLDALEPHRRRTLQCRGILALRVPATPILDAPAVRWVFGQADPTAAEHRWFIDGSLIHGQLPGCVAAGGAAVVVDASGAVQAVAQVQMPSTVRTAAAAETWMMVIVLSSSAHVPRIVTDCLGIVNTAQRGLEAAVGSKMPLAGLWNRIGAAVDGPLQRLVEDRKVVWMPAHKSLAAAATLRRSDGGLITPLEWRANRLADAHAKAAAAACGPSAYATSAVAKAIRVAAIELAALGAVTHAANNHMITVVRSDGTTGTTVVRDSVMPVRPTQRLRPRRRRGPASAEHAPAPPQPPAQPPAQSTASCTRLTRKRQHSPPAAATLEARQRRAVRRRHTAAAELLATQQAIASNFGRGPAPSSPDPAVVAAFVERLRYNDRGRAAMSQEGRGSEPIEGDVPPIGDAPPLSTPACASHAELACSHARESPPTPTTRSVPTPRGGRSGGVAKAARPTESLACLVQAHTRAYARSRSAKPKTRPAMVMRMPTPLAAPPPLGVAAERSRPRRLRCRRAFFPVVCEHAAQGHPSQYIYIYIYD